MSITPTEHKATCPGESLAQVTNFLWYCWKCGQLVNLTPTVENEQTKEESKWQPPVSL